MAPIISISAPSWAEAGELFLVFGVVQDGDTGEPIINVLPLLYYNGTFLGSPTVPTDADGFYRKTVSIDTEGTWTLKATYGAAEDTTTIEIGPTPPTLATVTVTGRALGGFPIPSMRLEVYQDDVLVGYGETPSSELQLNVPYQISYDVLTPGDYTFYGKMILTNPLGQAVYESQRTSVTTCQLTCQMGCEVSCQIGCQIICKTGCQVTCQFACEVTCLTTCEQYCQTGCEVSCQTSCQLACKLSCEISCKTTCQVSCQTGCELGCETGCEVSCEIGCQVVCQTGCQVTCQFACEVTCLTTCEQYCQTGCEVTCKTTCQISCQTACQVTCQPGCQVTCEIAAKKPL